jgi:mRNA interferase MazF
MSYRSFDVVVVPFPFTDRRQRKRRPAVVVSQARQFNTPTGHSVLAMITTQGHRRWPLDVEISDLDAASLPVESLVRMKLFTLDHRLVLRKIGRLAARDAGNVRRSLTRLFPLNS